MRGWVSPLLGVRFELEGGELVVFRSDGARFVGYEELAAALEEAQARAVQERLLREQERARAEQEHQRAEQERQRAERLAQKLRELGVEPE
jgi:ATPase subunit of ABC transporter with duplicated ATPase domains